MMTSRVCTPIPTQGLLNPTADGWVLEEKKQLTFYDDQRRRIPNARPNTPSDARPFNFILFHEAAFENGALRILDGTEFYLSRRGSFTPRSVVDLIEQDLEVPVPRPNTPHPNHGILPRGNMSLFSQSLGHPHSSDGNAST